MNTYEYPKGQGHRLTFVQDHLYCQTSALNVSHISREAFMIGETKVCSNDDQDDSHANIWL